LVALASQSPKPALQEMEQTPAVQLGVPPVVLQTLPHAPQALTFDATLVSHPFWAFASQSSKPAAQTGAQTPAVQLVVPLALVQVAPQAPQSVALF
jgi:hypothetical protein